jgi:hypothetical protein
MDSDNVRGEKPRRPAALPALDLLETSWRVKAPSGRIITCGIYRTDAPGLEVRVGFSEDDLLRSQRTADVASARSLTEQWRPGGCCEGGIRQPGVGNLSVYEQAPCMMPLALP